MSEWLEWERKDSRECIFPQDEATSAHLDGVFDILSERRRRYLLYYLRNATKGVAERPQLVAAVHTFENEDSATEKVSTEDSIQKDLHHVQLPKLADAGFISYDLRQGTVRYDPTPGLEEWLQRAHVNDFGRS